MLVSLQNSVKKTQNLVAFHANASPSLKQSNKHTFKTKKGQGIDAFNWNCKLLLKWDKIIRILLKKQHLALF